MMRNKDVQYNRSMTTAEIEGIIARGLNGQRDKHRKTD